MGASTMTMTSSAGKFTSSEFWAGGIAFVLLVLLGGTTWFVSPILWLVWVLGVSRILLGRVPATRAGW